MAYLLCFIPPLGVATTGRAGAFFLNLLLTLLFYLPGLIHAFFVVADHKANQRNEKLIEATYMAAGKIPPYKEESDSSVGLLLLVGFAIIFVAGLFILIS